MLLPSLFMSEGQSKTLSQKQLPSHSIAANQSLQATLQAKDFISQSQEKIKRKDFENAIRDLNLAEKLEAKSSSEIHKIYWLRANAYKALQLEEQAINDYTKALEIDNSDYKSLFNRANSLRSSGKTAAALNDFETCTKLKPDFNQAYTNCGVCQLELGESHKAISYFDTAISKSNNTDALAYFNRACAHKALGNLQASLADLNQTLELASSQPELLTKAKVLQQRILEGSTQRTNSQIPEQFLKGTE